MGKKCFVIAPIGDEGSLVRKRSDQIFRYVIEPAAKNFGYDAIRADHIAKPGLITSQVIEHIIQDDLVIADLTDRNPNVFYELAIRHAVRKPFIQIKETADTIPFDVTGMRTIDVDFRFIESMERCRDEIIKQIQTIEKDQFDVESPITFTLNIMSVRSDDNAQTKVIMDLVSQVQTLKSEIEKVRDYVKPNEIRLGSLNLEPLGTHLYTLGGLPEMGVEPKHDITIDFGKPLERFNEEKKEKTSKK